MFQFSNRQVFVLLMVLCGALSGFAQASARPLTAEPLKPDVRVLIDVSGSMKKNDPQNLRRPAVELLSKLLSKPAVAGIWAFGDRATILVPHAPVTDAWRQVAGERLHHIGSSDMFTHLGAALEASLAAGESRPDHRTSIILLTDGMVDIAKDPATNQREWHRVVEEVLPRVKQVGLVIHTIALSDQADRDLLNRLALETGGVAETARSADELMPIFLRILDTAAPAEQLILDGDRFRVDNSVQELTALVFRPSTEPVQLVTPGGDTLGHDERSSQINWFRADDYDLVTVNQPQTGEWQLSGSADSETRVTVVSNLNLRVRELPVNVYRGQAVNVSFGLQDNNQLVTRPEFLSLMTFDLQLQHRAVGGFETLWQSKLQPAEPPKSGIYNVQLPKFERDGDYRLLVQVDGKTFQREFRHNFSARMPFQAEILAQADGGGTSCYLLALYPNAAGLDPQQTQAVATLTTPADRRLVRPMPLTEEGIWQLPLQPYDEGRYGVAVTVAGVDQEGVEFSYRMDDMSFFYSPERGFVAEAAGQAPVNLDLAAVSEPLAEPPSQPEPEVAVPEVEPAAPAQSEPPTSSSAEAESRSLPMLAGMGVGNLALLGLAFWAYRRYRAQQPSAEQILEQFADEKLQVAAGPASANDPDAEDADLDESEMEDWGDKSADEGSIVAPTQADLAQDESFDPDEASLNEALASIMGELDADEAGAGDGFSLDEENSKAT